MSLENVQRWYDNLPPEERKLPLMIYDGNTYSPEQILSIVKGGGPLSAEFQKRVENRNFGTPDVEKRALAKERVKQLLKDRPIDVVRLTVPGNNPDKSADEIEAEVDAESGFGKELIDNEESYLEHIRRK